MYETTAEKRRLCHTSLVARDARKELDGDGSEKDCCVTQRWWLATLVGTRRGLQQKELLCHTKLVARYARRNYTGTTAKRTAASHKAGGSLRS